MLPFAARVGADAALPPPRIRRRLFGGPRERYAWAECDVVPLIAFFDFQKIGCC